MKFNIGISELPHREATNTEVFRVSRGFREHVKSKPIYSGHILDQCLENWDTAVSSLSHVVYKISFNEERPKAHSSAWLLSFVFMYFRMYHIYDANFYSKVKKDIFSPHNKDIKLVVYILVQTFNWVLPELSYFSEYQTRQLLHCCCLLLSSVSQSLASDIWFQVKDVRSLHRTDIFRFALKYYTNNAFHLHLDLILYHIFAAWHWKQLNPAFVKISAA